MTDSYDFMTDVDVVQKPAAKKRGRIWELDFIRGFLILRCLRPSSYDGRLLLWAGMAHLSHGATNGFTRFYAAAEFYMNHPAREVIHPIVVFTFITLCGLSTGFSRNNMKRACTLALISIGITTATAIADSFEPGMIIRFGIIHLLATCVATWAVIELITRHNKFLNFLFGHCAGICYRGAFDKVRIRPRFPIKGCVRRFRIRLYRRHFRAVTRRFLADSAVFRDVFLCGGNLALSLLRQENAETKT